MLELSLDDVQAAFDRILADVLPSDLVYDQLTGSAAMVLDDLGYKPNKYGKLVHLLHVKVKKPALKTHHKVNDCVIWEDPLPCGL